MRDGGIRRLTQDVDVEGDAVLDDCVAGVVASLGSGASVERVRGSLRVSLGLLLQLDAFVQDIDDLAFAFV